MGAHPHARQKTQDYQGEFDDIARATLFFTDPQNDWVTGQTLFVCGGASLGSLTVI